MRALERGQGVALRDPRYHDLCAFFRTMPPGQRWMPAVGDWVARAPGVGVGLIIAVDGQTLSMVDIASGDQSTLAVQDAIWLPTLDQLRDLMAQAFGTCGVFTSSFNGRAWWFTGNIMGMTLTNLEPLAEGASAEEAAIKALLMNEQR